MPATLIAMEAGTFNAGVVVQGGARPKRATGQVTQTKGPARRSPSQVELEAFLKLQTT
jgi:hypothetical protein